jgi:serine/threonine-protein kinase
MKPMGKPGVPTFPGNDGLNLVGRRVGRYELLYEIAAGGMASVYLARARGASGFERIVAAKIPHPHLRKDEEFAPMFLDEARLAAKIHHPNVVPVLDFGEAGALYLVMDYVEGHHLAGLIRAAGKKGQRIPPGVTLRILVDALSGLHAAHELKDTSGAPLNIVHRDTSPQNVLIGVDGIARITDFGIARAEARATITRDGQVKGKLSYIAPEQLAGEAVTRRADIFGMGVLLWEALVGQRLFRADSEAETVNLLLSGEVRRPSTIVPGLPSTLDDVVLKALERYPDQRYATAAEFADALENCGVKVATPRQVAALVEELVGESLAQRREEVKNILESGAEFTSLSPSLPVDQAGTPLALDDVPRGLRRNDARRTQLVIGASAAVVAIVAFIALRSGNSDTNASPAGTQTTTRAGAEPQGGGARAATGRENDPSQRAPTAVNTAAESDAGAVVQGADAAAAAAEQNAAAETRPTTETGSSNAAVGHPIRGSDASSRSHLAPGSGNGASSGGTTGSHRPNSHRREFSPGSI